jgi:superoxide dismutase, Cu-Zn family
MKALLIAVTAAGLASCQMMPGQGGDAPRAIASLTSTKGSKAFGEVTFEQVGNRVQVVAFTQGLAPGQEHGFHIHEGSSCGPDGMAAGGHFNPGGKPHGDPKAPAAQRHAGDMPNLQADKRGRARMDIQMDGVSLRPGPNNIVGRTVVIHAGPDDYKSQPAGDSGARIACGVITAA